MSDFQYLVGGTPQKLSCLNFAILLSIHVKKTILLPFCCYIKPRDLNSCKILVRTYCIVFPQRVAGFNYKAYIFRIIFIIQCFDKEGSFFFSVSKSYTFLGLFLLEFQTKTLLQVKYKFSIWTSGVETINMRR